MVTLSSFPDFTDEGRLYLSHITKKKERKCSLFMFIKLVAIISPKHEATGRIREKSLLLRMCLKRTLFFRGMVFSFVYKREKRTKVFASECLS